jgi:PKD domain
MSRPVSVLALAVALACGACRSGGASPPRVAPSSPSSAGNHPPTVRARCAPCAIAVGRTVSLTADAQDADGDTLTYAWSAPAGSASASGAKQTTWTAPAVDGPVPVTVRVSDGKGGLASDVITITVTK